MDTIGDLEMTLGFRILDPKLPGTENVELTPVENRFIGTNPLLGLHKVGAKALQSPKRLGDGSERACSRGLVRPNRRTGVRLAHGGKTQEGAEEDERDSVPDPDSTGRSYCGHGTAH